MTSDGDNADGSWIPTLAVCFLMLLWWISCSPSSRAVRIRRWYNTKRVHWKTKFGLRDETIYRGAAGDGANQSHKRQG
eukprot:CAMPEP_0197177638 /NCGR_PEP_ID=MMETSP1423-20130617/3177_1 /TAXON_ID=476441 /ORGANISM="Pseudo-nitzschia heimii, Strain UNC1101" /LENGTH=77 /DNA_ID=CAMNT_0042627217 /DNA_START=138 /DNA_END=371 /DNA_ORIENTATION=-